MPNTMEGHGKLCPLCDTKMDALAGNPGLWPVGTCTRHKPGFLTYFCQRCVGNLVGDALDKKEANYGRLSNQESTPSMAPSNEGESKE